MATCGGCSFPATRAWAPFAVARDNGFAGVVIGMQANPGWSGTPVIMGDSHIFRIDKPMIGARSGNVIEKVLRLEVPGSAYVHWVRLKVDPAKVGLFSFEHENVVENFFPQQRPWPGGQRAGRSRKVIRARLKRSGCSIMRKWPTPSMTW